MAESILRKAALLAGSVEKALRSVYVGGDEQVRVVVASLMAGGHILIEGPPGTGKTLLAKALAKATGGSFGRVQGHPDVLPSDITGFHIYSPDGSSRFVEGPVFSNVVMIDELNRIPARSQAAVLEAMQEGQVTVDGRVYKLPHPQVFIATQIPYEDPRTVYTIIQALMDRFMARVRLGYQEERLEARIVLQSDRVRVRDPPVEPVTSPEGLSEAVRAVERVYVDSRIVEYIVALVSWIRKHPQVQLGPSHRATVDLYRASRALALMDGRDYVIPDDVKTLAPYILAHRVWLRQAAPAPSADEIVGEALRNVPVPKV